MFPGMGGRMNPKQINAMMRQMGIKMDEIEDVEEVIIRTRTKDIVLTRASVAKMNARGEISWQITGDESERPRGQPEAAPAAEVEILESDVELVASQGGVSKEEARKALEAANGEVAQALVAILERA